MQAASNLRLTRLMGHLAASSGLEAAGALAVPARVSAADDRPVVCMLELPAESAVSSRDVEEAFATHDVQVTWADDGISAENAAKVSAICTVKKKIDPAVLDQFPNLRLVAVSFTGFDHVDLAECTKRGIKVVNVPGYSTDGVAELVFGLIFSLLRHIPIAHQHVREGKWNWPPGNELSGKSFGIIGTGKIGMRICEIAKVFKVKKILGFDTFKNPKFTEEVGGEYVSSLASLFLHADVIVVACALTPETKGLVGRKLLKLLRPESIIINAARGPIIDQAALTEMLMAKRFRAGLDVYEVEPLAADHELRRVPDTHIVTTPHLAYKCNESLHRRLDITLANILAFFSESPQNLCN